MKTHLDDIAESTKYACGVFKNTRAKLGQLTQGVGWMDLPMVDCKRCMKTEPYLVARNEQLPKPLEAKLSAGEFIMPSPAAGLPGPWELPGFMKVDAVAALSAVTLYEHLRNDGVPAFDAMRSTLAAYMETL